MGQKMLRSQKHKHSILDAYKEYLKMVFTSSRLKGGWRGFPHTSDNLSNCQKKMKL